MTYRSRLILIAVLMLMGTFPIGLSLAFIRVVSSPNEHWVWLFLFFFSSVNLFLFEQIYKLGQQSTKRKTF